MSEVDKSAVPSIMAMKMSEINVSASFIYYYANCKKKRLVQFSVEIED